MSRLRRKYRLNCPQYRPPSKVRKLSADEVAGIAASNGWAVAPKAPAAVRNSIAADDVWWTDEELAQGNRGVRS